MGSASRWFAVATTRSPGSKRRLPLPGFSRAFSAAFRACVPAGAAVHRRDHLDLLGRDAERARDRVGDELHDPVRRLGRSARRHDRRPRGSGRRPAAAPRRAPRSRAGRWCRPRPAGTACVSSVTGTVPESMRSPSTRPGPIEGSWAASPTNTRCVPSAHARQQRVGQLDVEHRRLVDHHDVLVQRPVLAAGEAAVEAHARPRTGAAGRRAAGAASTPARRTAPRAAWRPARSARRARPTCPAVFGQRDERRDGAALAGARAAGQHA